MHKKLFTILSVLFAFVGACFASTSGFSGEASEYAKVLDKKELVFDSTKSVKNWNTIYRLPIADFKRGQYYKISCDIEGLDATFNGYIILAVMREQAVYKRLYCDYRKGKTQSIDYFILSEDIKNPVFEIRTYAGVKAIISNFKIEECASPISFEPMFKSESVASLNKAKFPKGAKEFTVDEPRNPNGTIVHAKDFGILPNSEITFEQINKAINHCRKIKAAKLLFEKNATYQVHGKAGILIERMQDFIFDGNGSTFVFRKTKAWKSLFICNCERVVVENLNADWNEDEDPLAAIVRVENMGIENGKRFVDYRFIHWDKYPLYGKRVRLAAMSSWDEKENSVGKEMSFCIAQESSPDKKPQSTTKWLEPNLVRIYGWHHHLTQKGQLYRMQHYYYEIDFQSSHSCKHLIMRNINVWATPGHGFFLGGDSEYNLCKNIKITLHPSKDKRRVITSCADHFGAINCLGNIKLEDCEFGYGADDCINFHDKTMMALVNSPNSIICRDRYAWQGDPIEFRKMNYAPTGTTLKIVKQNKLPDGKYEMFFDGEIPAQKGNRLLMFNRSRHSNNMIVRNCYFHHNRAHGIMAQSSNMTIENCKFERNEMGAMKIESGYRLRSWCEGYGVDNVVVRNCEFIKPNPLPELIWNKEWCIFIGTFLVDEPPLKQSDYPVVKNILFENNKFVDCYGMTALIGSAKNIIFTGNTFENSDTRKRPRDYRNCFYTLSSSDVKIVNNKFKKSDLTPKLGVYIEKDSCKNITIKGNKLVDERK